MDADQVFQEAMARSTANGEGDGSRLEKLSMPISAAVSDSDTNHSKGLDCNICLEFVQDPVVTLCGHLYCWPCIYTWLHPQATSESNDETGAQKDHHQQRCPVCKSEVSHSTLVPLYGRGKTTNLSEGKACHIPRRPSSPSCSIRALLTTSRASTGPRPAPHLSRDYLYESQPYHPQLGGNESRMLEASHPFPEMMIGEIMYARMFGSSAANLPSYQNSYHLAGSSNPRLRRQLARADKSLGRICFFLCCCILACLVLF